MIYCSTPVPPHRRDACFSKEEGTGTHDQTALACRAEAAESPPARGRGRSLAPDCQRLLGVLGRGRVDTLTARRTPTGSMRSSRIPPRRSPSGWTRPASRRSTPSRRRTPTSRSTWRPTTEARTAPVRSRPRSRPSTRPAAGGPTSSSRRRTTTPPWASQGTDAVRRTGRQGPLRQRVPGRLHRGRPRTADRRRHRVRPAQRPRAHRALVRQVPHGPVRLHASHDVGGVRGARQEGRDRAPRLHRRRHRRRLDPRGVLLGRPRPR